MTAERERIRMTVEDLADYLTGTTVITCHPSREAEVRDALVQAAPPKPYRVTTDPEFPTDQVILYPPAHHPEWTP